MAPQLAGHWFRSDSRYGPLFHAALRPAQENSGKLVTLVKQQARLLALDEGYDAVLVDGPPGIGCPVISAASGADLALIVAEPTAAGIHDMARVLAMTAHFRVAALVCINKADIYCAGSAEIEAYCREHGIEVIGHIPFDESVTQAMVQGQPVTAYAPDARGSRALVSVWERVSARKRSISWPLRSSRAWASSPSSSRTTRVSGSSSASTRATLPSSDPRNWRRSPPCTTSSRLWVSSFWR
jgi:MinD superfamily P-loop ATPase